MFRTGVEAIRSAPGAYAKGVALGLTGLLLLPYTEAVESNGPAAVAGTPIGDAVLGPPGRGRRLPPDVLTTGALWARAVVKSWSLDDTGRYSVEGGLRNLPDGIWQLERRRLVWSDPADAARYAVLRERLRRFVQDTSSRDRRRGSARRCGWGRSSCRRAGSGSSSLSRSAWSRPSWLAAPLLVAGAGMLVLLETALAFPSPDYALPFVPAFALVAVAALAQGRRGRRPTVSSTSAARRGEAAARCPILGRIEARHGSETLACDAGWRPWLFVKATTDDGLVGWSEVADSHGSPTGPRRRRDAPLVVGRDPLAVEAIHWDIYRRTRQSPGSIVQKAIGESRTRCST